MRFFTEKIPLAARFYITGIILLSLPILAGSLYDSLLQGNYYWLLLAGLAVLASCFPVKIPLVKGKQILSITVSDVFIFVTILLFGPSEAVVVGLAEAMTTDLKRKVKAYKRVFNVSQLALTSYLVGHFFYTLVEQHPPLDPDKLNSEGLLFLLVGFCGLLYFVANSGIVAIAISLVSRQPILRVWKQNFGWAAVTTVAASCLGAVIFIYFRELQFYSLAITAPIVLLLYHAYRLTQNRVQETLEHLAQVNDLLAKKIEAERELQLAKEELEIRVEERAAELKEANEQLLVEISERRLAEQALAAEKERLSVTLASIGDGVITTDTTGRVFLLNKVAENLTGWTMEEAFGVPLPEVFHAIHLRSRRKCNLLPKALGNPEEPPGPGVPIALVCRDGQERRISHSVAPIRETNGAVLGAVLVFKDISDQLKMEEELTKAQKLESLGILAGGIAHDFNNIPAGILLKTQLARRVQKQGQDPTQLLASIEEAVTLASGLTQQLLTFARGGAPIKETMSLQDLLKESARFALRGSRSRCEFAIPDDLWAVEADKGQISQVINNLVINADQAMPNGGTIRIWAENVENEPTHPVGDLEQGIYVRVVVEDEGVGISPEDLHKIFDPYFTTKKSGHGLGLASTYSILQRHGGNIFVESQLGKGTRFTFYLPATREAPAAKQTSQLVPTGQGRILVMDDDEVIRTALEQLLKELGYEPFLTTDGRQAIEAYSQALREQQPFEAVILDLTIPGGRGGRETITQLKELDPQVTAIVSSGYSKDPVMADHEAYGFKAVLSKPYTLGQLGRILQDVLQHKPRLASPLGQSAGSQNGQKHPFKPSWSKGLRTTYPFLPRTGSSSLLSRSEEGSTEPSSAPPSLKSEAR